LVQSPILEMDEKNKLLFYKVPSSGKNMLCYNEKTHEGGGGGTFSKQNSNRFGGIDGMKLQRLQMSATRVNVA